MSNKKTIIKKIQKSSKSRNRKSQQYRRNAKKTKQRIYGYEKKFNNRGKENTQICR